jgi:hypothetical protein
MSVNYYQLLSLMSHKIKVFKEMRVIKTIPFCNSLQPLQRQERGSSFGINSSYAVPNIIEICSRKGGRNIELLSHKTIIYLSHIPVVKVSTENIIKLSP